MTLTQEIENTKTTIETGTQKIKGDQKYNQQKEIEEILQKKFDFKSTENIKNSLEDSIELFKIIHNYAENPKNDRYQLSKIEKGTKIDIEDLKKYHMLNSEIVRHAFEYEKYKIYIDDVNKSQCTYEYLLDTYNKTYDYSSNHQIRSQTKSEYKKTIDKFVQLELLAKKMLKTHLESNKYSEEVKYLIDSYREIQSICEHLDIYNKYPSQRAVDIAYNHKIESLPTKKRKSLMSRIFRR